MIKHQKQWMVALSIVFLCIDLSLAQAANRKATVLDREAMKVFEESMSGIVIRCGASNYVQSSGDLYELGKMSINVGISELSAADVANGYEWMGYGNIYYSMARMYDRGEGAWGDWEMGLVIGAGGRELNRRRGKWIVEESNWEAPEQPISCIEIPK